MVRHWDGYMVVYHLVEGRQSRADPPLLQCVPPEILEDGRDAVGGTPFEWAARYKADSLTVDAFKPVDLCSLIRGPYR